MKKLNLKTILGLCTVILINAALLSSFHQKTWAPHEDGYFANVAERLLQGEALYKNVESRHAGYIHFVNARVMSLFGHTLATPRIPVIFLSLIQSVILYLLFVPLGLFAALLASFVSTILGYLQCLTPSTHWYCLFLSILIAIVLYKMPPRNRLRLPLLGFLLGLIILFRQLTGFFSGTALLICLLTENSSSEKKSNPLLARLLLLLSCALLAVNFKNTFEINAFFLFGLWPCFLFLWAFCRTRCSNHKALSLSLQLGFGLLVAFLPLFFYLWHHHAFLLWIDDTLIRSSRMLKTTPYVSWSAYALYQAGGAFQILHHDGLRLTLNGIYWFLLPLAGFLNGLGVFLLLLKKEELSPQEAFPLMAVFYGIVSYTLQIPIYLYYTVSLSLLSLLWISKNYFKKLSLFISTCIVFLLAVGFYYHAGQPAQRGLRGMLAGERHVLKRNGHLAKLDLAIQQADENTYEELIDYIKMKTGSTDSIFVFPNNPEVYFLADRKNPFRFTITSTALQSQQDLRETIAQLHASPPKMILYNREDKYNTPLGVQLLEEVTANYRHKKTILPFEIYEKDF